MSCWIRKSFKLPFLLITCFLLICLGYKYRKHFEKIEALKRLTIPMDRRINILQVMTKDVLLLANQSNIPLMLMYGSLLGIIRENQLPLKHDFDVDLGIEEKHYNEFCTLVSKLRFPSKVYDYGPHKKIRIWDTETDLNIDIFAIHTSKEGKSRRMVIPYLTSFFLNECSEWFDSSVFFPMQPIKVLEQTVFIPNQPEELLKCWYGSSWTISDKFCELDGFCRRQ